MPGPAAVALQPMATAAKAGNRAGRNLSRSMFNYCSPFHESFGLRRLQKSSAQSDPRILKRVSIFGDSFSRFLGRQKGKCQFGNRYSQNVSIEISKKAMRSRQRHDTLLTSARNNSLKKSSFASTSKKEGTKCSAHYSPYLSP